MLNKIIDGISIRLNDIFEDYPIYSEQIKQGFKEPCFFILPLSPSLKQIVGSRYQRYNPFDIHFFPGDLDNIGVDDVAEKLLEALEYITVEGNLIRGMKRHYEKVDGVLHFFVEYNLHTVKPVEKINMEILEVSAGLKGELN